MLPDDSLYRLKTCRNGTFLYNPNDRYIGRSLDLFGEFSQGEANLFAEILKPGDVALDIGANIGCHTVVMAKAVAPGGFVIGFEPQRLVHQLLCSNVALNGLINVVCRQNAVGREAGKITVPVLDPSKMANFGGLDLRRDWPGEPVDVLVVDNVALPQCRLIKIDVEGMETEVIEGARQTIERLRPILYVENDRQDNAEALVRLIHAMDYRLYWHCPPLFNPDNFDCNQENPFGNIVSKNLFCVPKEAKTEIKGAREIVVV
ncbi:FkbM family methyltransferase [Magnetospira sp. QH-2]|uniref:FkbM family methyltransferase n=1 Tax=Magnetospira sp. (strain QH-2) TaxID=1288970 RepID=UPI0003E81B05|nr:FkbM family methyltransferase [Magnetospira sp. QH-2]CCQ73266.1 Putative SAM-dependent methyltransferase [Magnetospira sp. QH-2]